MSCGVAYTFQVIAQKYTEPTVTSLILCLESVFAVVGGIIILNEQISMRETLGCIIMFAAILLAQIPVKKNVTDRISEKDEAILDPEM
jgi:drug/metabolite transporter (DMT)-like permease